MYVLLVVVSLLVNNFGINSMCINFHQAISINFDMQFVVHTQCWEFNLVFACISINVFLDTREMAFVLTVAPASAVLSCSH